MLVVSVGKGAFSGSNSNVNSAFCVKFLNKCSL